MRIYHTSSVESIRCIVLVLVHTYSYINYDIFEEEEIHHAHETV